METVTEKSATDLIELWRSEAIEALSVPEIASGIGQEKADRMKRIAEEAGEIVVDDRAVVHLKDSDLNIYFCLTVQPNTGKSIQIKRRIGRLLRHSKTVKVSTINEVPNFCSRFEASEFHSGTLSLPVDTPELDIKPIMVHELTHAMQATKRGASVDLTDLMATKREAEAYRNQFIVHDFLEGGIPSLVVKSLLHQIKGTDLKAHVLLNTAYDQIGLGGMRSKPLVATLAETAINYTNYNSTGEASPSLSLVEFFRDFGLIRSR